MFKKSLIIFAACFSFTALATTSQQAITNPHQVRAYTRHMQKCQLLYQDCMQRYCKGQTAANCNMATHCNVEYQKYCVSEGNALQTSNSTQQSQRAQAQKQLVSAQQACSQQLRLRCAQQQQATTTSKQCTPDAAYNECMRAAQRNSR